MPQHLPIHDLGRLLTLLDAPARIPERVREAGRLTRYAVVTRYPGVTEPVTDAEHGAAVAIAESILEWAEEQLDG